MTATETILFATVWGLLGCGLFFAWRSRRRKARNRRPPSQP